MRRVSHRLVTGCLALSLAAGTTVWVPSFALAGASDKSATSGATDTAALAKKIAALEAIVNDLEERKKIHEVYVRYGRGIDRLDDDLLRSVYWPGAQVNYGVESNNSIEEYLGSHTKWFRESGTVFGHLLTNEAIDLKGDVAHVETYVTGMLTFREKENKIGSSGLVFSGRYIDRLERRNGEWRISVREFLPHFTMKADTSNWETQYGRWFTNAKSDCVLNSGKRDTSYLRPLENRKDKAVGPPCVK